MIEVLYVLIATALACAVLGPFIVLRNLSMVADALSHSVLLGIVIAFIVVQDLSSPFLVISAALFGVLTVFLVEFISKKRKIKQDDALGIVFPMFFSLAVVLITKLFRNAHLDVDIVLMGNPLFTPFIRMFNLPKSFVVMLFLFVVNTLFIVLFYKELQLSTFDAQYVKMTKIKSTRLYYSLMTLTSITCVSAFDSVGAILVISLFVAPAVIAYLFAKRLQTMIVCSLLASIIICTLGYFLGVYYNVSISGMCSFIGMILCIIAIFINPKGVIFKLFQKKKSKQIIRKNLILIHLYKHPNDFEECGIHTIHKHLNWSATLFQKYAQELIDNAYIYHDENGQVYALTTLGLEQVKSLLESV